MVCRPFLTKASPLGIRLPLQRFNMRLLHFLPIIAVVSASPVADPQALNLTSIFCAAVKAIVTKVKAQSTATAYCSSYLSIKTSTVTSTPTVIE